MVLTYKIFFNYLLTKTICIELEGGNQDVEKTLVIEMLEYLTRPIRTLNRQGQKGFIYTVSKNEKVCI